jgi:hypothetical protein
MHRDSLQHFRGVVHLHKDAKESILGFTDDDCSSNIYLIIVTDFAEVTQSQPAIITMSILGDIPPVHRSDHGPD